MEKTKRNVKMRPAMVACLCAVLLFGSMATAYAADVGGIQERIHTWFHGEETEMAVTDHGDGSYTFTYEEEGQLHEVGGGGVSMAADGAVSTLAPEEVAESFANEVDTKVDGTVWLYYKDRAVDITEYLVDGACKVVLEDQGEKVYFDIQDNGGGGYGFTRSSDPTGSAADYIAVN